MIYIINFDLLHCILLTLEGGFSSQITGSECFVNCVDRCFNNFTLIDLLIDCGVSSDRHWWVHKKNWPINVLAFPFKSF